MKLYRVAAGAYVSENGRWSRVRDFSFDRLFREERPQDWLRARLESCAEPATAGPLPAPLESQEVWAAGVTYLRSRDARMAESEAEASVYDRVYEAERPELFFKATPHRVVGQGGEVRIRGDSGWDVPEAEVAFAVTRAGRIFGVTVGNDMSSRRIEAANPLYLPQAKIYDGCCALGPCLLLADAPLPEETAIALRILRGGVEVFAGSTTLAMLKRRPEELVEYLFRDNSFPAGCYLLTGTGIVPDEAFTLAAGDEVEITIAPIGTLRNRVVKGGARDGPPRGGV